MRIVCNRTIFKDVPIEIEVCAAPSPISLQLIETMETNAYTIGFFLSRSSLAMRQVVNLYLKDEGVPEVSMGFIGVLMALYESDGQGLSEIGESVALERSTMTGLVDRMMKAGLVTREQDPDDRRVQRVRLTDRGREVRPIVERVLSESYFELTRGIDPSDVVKAEKVLNRLIENAREACKNGH